MGCFESQVSPKGDDLIAVNGRPVLIMKESDPAAVDWAAAGAEYVVDASGKFTTAAAAAAHLTSGAKIGSVRLAAASPFPCRLF